MWASSKMSVATVNQSGTVVAIAEGTSTITATAGGKMGSCVVTVSKGVVDVSSINLDKTSASLKVGETVTLTATVKPDDATNKTVTWSTSDASVATVSDGVVTAIKLGAATITAKAGDKEATCAITVEPTPVTAITLDRTSATLRVGETVTLTATVKPDDATDKAVTWSTSDASIATVSEGVVTAVKIGAAIITAKAGDKEAPCAINIEATPVSSVTLDKTDVSLKVGETVTLTATVKPDDATDKTVTWSTSDASVAIVSGGVVTAVKLGNATIRAMAGDKEATCAITVEVTPVTSVTLDKESLTLLVENTATLKATILPDDATDKTVIWESSDTSIATVEDGVVRGISPGAVIITATSGNLSASCNVSVFKDAADGVFAKYYGGSYFSLDGMLQPGSKLNFGVVNYSTETIRVVSASLTDSRDGVVSYQYSIETDIVSGSSAAWTMTIGGIALYAPIARFEYIFRDKTYTCEAQFIATSIF